MKKNFFFPQFLVSIQRVPRKKILQAIMGGSLTVYMLYHFFQGHRGFFALLQLRQVIQEEKKSLTNLEEEIIILKRRVRLLRNNNLDQDLLDERVRFVLNMASPSDIILKEEDVLKAEEGNAKTKNNIPRH